MFNSLVSVLNSGGNLQMSLQVATTNTGRLHVVRAIASLPEAARHLDVLILCAGEATSTPFDELTPDEWKRIVDVNLNGTFNVLHAAKQLLNNEAAVVIAAMQTGIRFPGFENDMRIFVTENIMEDGGKLQSPTMVIHDACDPLAPVAHIDWFTSLVPKCKRLSVETAGHLIWVGPDSELMHRSRVQFVNEHIGPPTGAPLGSACGAGAASRPP